MSNLDRLFTQDMSAKHALGQIGLDRGVPNVVTVADAREFFDRYRDFFDWNDDTSLTEAAADWLLSDLD